MERIRWGIIGCGAVTEVKSGPAFKLAAGSELVAVMRRQGALAADYAKRHAVPRWYDDADRLLQDRDVDAVYIATPPGAHHALALKACAAGKPAYVEKPMARHHIECLDMTAAFRARGVKLFVAYYRRALPRFLEAKAIVDSGRLGRIESVAYRSALPAPTIDPAALPWRWRAAEAGGGLFFDLGSHTLDVLDFLFGPLEQVEGQARRRSDDYAVEDAVDMRFATGSGAEGSASWDFRAETNVDQLRINGRRGDLTMSVFGSTPLFVSEGATPVELGFENPRHIEQPMIQTVVDDLLERGACASTGESAARTAAVMDAVTTNYYGSRAEAFWQHPGSWPGTAKG